MGLHFPQGIESTAPTELGEALSPQVGDTLVSLPASSPPPSHSKQQELPGHSSGPGVTNCHSSDVAILINLGWNKPTQIPSAPAGTAGKPGSALEGVGRGTRTPHTGRVMSSCVLRG